MPDIRRLSLADEGYTAGQKGYSPERLFAEDSVQVKVQIDLTALEVGACHFISQASLGIEDVREVEGGFTLGETARREEERDVT